MIRDADISLQLKHTLADQFGLDAARLTDDARLADLGLDSMHLVDVMLELESRLGVRLAHLPLPVQPRLADLVAAVRGNLPAAA